MKLDLGWGNSIAVREAFLEAYNQSPLIFGRNALMGFDYPNHTGDPELVEITRSVIKRQMGLEYKHVFIVNGATGGCVISLRAYKMQNFDFCRTRNAPFYVRYPKMIESSGLEHIQEDYPDNAGTVNLIDLPSNPLGMMNDVSSINNPVILDGVYLNKVYMPPAMVQAIPHNVYVGSYSKLLGINGIRLGWIATNDDMLADRIKELLTSEYCGLSTASQEILKSTVPDLNWDLFETRSRFKMDMNREKWSKLEKYFGDVTVKEVGMFYYAPTDQTCVKLLEKAGIHWTKGSAMGTDDGFGRFNLGQDNYTIEEAVSAILKADRV